MSILVIGVNHRTGPIEVMERITLVADQIPKAVQTLVGRDNVREAVVVSTCNRTEVYAVTERFHGAYADIRDFLCDIGRISPDELHPYLFSEHDEAAVQHLFEVAAGLDSAVVGESEILGQLRAAWETAHREGGARSTLNMLFRQAIEVGKRARTETNISRGTASVSHAAVEMARDHHGDLSGCSIAVLGAGAMGEGIAVALTGAGAGAVTVVNRSPERGVSLADRVGGTAVGLDEMTSVLSLADVVLTSTGSGEPVVTRALMDAVDRAGRPLLFVDIAVPRDVASDVAELDGVTVLDLDDLKAWAARGRTQRLAEVDLVNEIISAEVERFTVEASARQAAPLVAALRQRGEDHRQDVLDRHGARLAHLSDADRELIEVVTRGIVAKLLHAPSVRLRDEAGTPQGERNAAAVADLFDLG